MCLIVAHPKGADPMDKDFAHLAWEQNSDGAGYMFARKGVLVIRKPFFRFTKFWQSYLREMRKYGEHSDFVVHFRWATHGLKDYVNTHPHILVPGRLGMVHNGIITIDRPDPMLSDTVTFCNERLKPLRERPEILYWPEAREELTAMVGPGNKLVFLDGRGEAVIINRGSGHRRWGSWHSTWVSERYCSRVGFGAYGSDDDLSDLIRYYVSRHESEATVTRKEIEAWTGSKPARK